MSTISRRDMLKTGAVGIAAGLAASGCTQMMGKTEYAAAAPPVLGPDEPVRTGFIGVGGRGTGLLNTYLKLPGQQVVAVCDMNQEHANRAVAAVEKAQGKAPDACVGGPDEFKRLLERKDVHAIVTATPCFEHARIMLETFKAGKHIYGEKPLAINVADANACQAAAEANPKIIAQVGFQWMASPRFIETVGKIHNGEIGDLIEGRFFRHNQYPGLHGWFSFREKSGDWMLEQACHEYNIMNWINGAAPLKAYGLGRHDLLRENDPDRNVTDYYAAIIEYPKGVIVHYAHGWISAPGFGEFAQKAIGTKGSIEIGGERVAAVKKEYEISPLVSKTGDDTQFALETFIESIRTGKPSRSTVANARDVTILALMVRKAVYERREVTWSETLRTC